MNAFSAFDIQAVNALRWASPEAVRVFMVSGKLHSYYIIVTIPQY
jgi:hypothetical protein